MATVVLVKRAKVSYWAGGRLVRVGDLLAPDDPAVIADYVEDDSITTAV